MDVAGTETISVAEIQQSLGIALQILDTELPLAQSLIDPRAALGRGYQLSDRMALRKKAFPLILRELLDNEVSGLPPV
jgi:hypothetical protein